MKTINNLLENSNYNYSFTEEFDEIIRTNAEGYGDAKNDLKSFLEDLQQGGCMSGMISEFIYNSDCKDFYVKYIDDMEDMKKGIEDEMGEVIKNRHDLPHYTFMCWLCFEEYCNDLYNNIF